MQQGLTTLKAPQPYLDLLRQIQSNQAAVRSLTPDQFRDWSIRRSPGIDTSAAIFENHAGNPGRIRPHSRTLASLKSLVVIMVIVGQTIAFCGLSAGAFQPALPRFLIRVHSC